MGAKEVHLSSIPFKRFSVMKLAALISVAFILCSAFPVSGQDRGTPQLTRDKTGYALGVSIGRNMKDLAIDIEPEMIVRGIRDVLKGKPTLSDQEIRTALDNYEKEVIKKLGAKNRQEGDAFLKENKSRKNVITLPSGLQYMVLKQGTGAVPKVNDMVAIHYRARTVDGVEFESSHWNNKPANIVIGNTIKGWTEALTKMPGGSIWRLYIPPELAYGESGAGTTIGPNATIICDLELLTVK